MNAGDQIRLSQHEHVRGISKINRVIFEPRTSITLFGRVVRHDQRTHRTVDDEDTLFEKFADIGAVESHSIFDLRLLI